jgi:hypothetical protein
VQVQGERQQGRQQEGGEGGWVRRQGGDGPCRHAGDDEGDEDVEDARIDVDEEPGHGAPGDAGEQRAHGQSARQLGLLARLEATGPPAPGPGQPQSLRREAEGQPGSNQGGRRVGDREEGEDDGDGGIDDGKGGLLAQQLAEQNGPWPRATAGRRDRGGWCRDPRLVHCRVASPAGAARDQGPEPCRASMVADRPMPKVES